MNVVFAVFLEVFLPFVCQMLVSFLSNFSVQLFNVRRGIYHFLGSILGISFKMYRA